MSYDSANRSRLVNGSTLYEISSCGTPRTMPPMNRPPERQSSCANSSAVCTGWRSGSTCPMTPTFIRSVFAMSAAASGVLDGFRLKYVKWCSLTNTPSNPSSSQ